MARFNFEFSPNCFKLLQESLSQKRSVLEVAEVNLLLEMNFSASACSYWLLFITWIWCRPVTIIYSSDQLISNHLANNNIDISFIKIAKKGLLTKVNNKL